MTTQQTTTPGARRMRKTRIGVVVSTGMDKTIAVNIERQVPHPLYKKYFKKSKKFLVHDAQSEAHLGDKVLIMETRPLSKRKRWRLVRVVEQAR